MSMLDASVPPGDEKALKGLLWSLNHPDANVRQISIDGLQRLAKLGQSSVVTCLQMRLQDPRCAEMNMICIGVCAIKRDREKEGREGVTARERWKDSGAMRPACCFMMMQ